VSDEAKLYRETIEAFLEKTEHGKTEHGKTGGESPWRWRGIFRAVLEKGKALREQADAAGTPEAATPKTGT
jgi:hypothetical protein